MNTNLHQVVLEYDSTTKQKIGNFQKLIHKKTKPVNKYRYFVMRSNNNIIHRRQKQITKLVSS